MGGVRLETDSRTAFSVLHQLKHSAWRANHQLCPSLELLILLILTDAAEDGSAAKVVNFGEAASDNGHLGPASSERWGGVRGEG